MIKAIAEFYNDSQKYVKVFNEFAKKHKLIGKAVADHICYKCDSSESFELVRALLETESAFIYQSIISNRRIAYIKMKRGINTVLGTIYFLELSDQKADGSQKEGFDHIEVYTTLFSYDHMVRKLQESETVLHVQRPHHTTDDINIGEGFLFRCAKGPLLEKIKVTEML